MAEYKPIHIGGNRELFAGNGSIGRYVLLPGGMDRAEQIASHFESVRTAKRRTEHTVWFGTYRGIDVAAVSSGMGPASTGIIVPELINSGVRRILRVGSCGAKQEGIPVGACIIATGAVRDEAVSDAYAPKEYPAVAHPDAVLACERAASRMTFEGGIYKGIVHTKDALEREIREGPLAAVHEAYMKTLQGCGVIASSMEEAPLFVIASVLRPHSVEVQAGSVLAVYGGWKDGKYIPYAPEKERKKAEEHVIQLGLEAIVEWAKIDYVISSQHNA